MSQARGGAAPSQVYGHDLGSIMKERAALRKARLADEAETVRQLHARGLSVRDMSGRLGWSRSRVWNALSRLQLKCNPETE